LQGIEKSLKFLNRNRTHWAINGNKFVVLHAHVGYHAGLLFINTQKMHIPITFQLL